MWEINWLQVNAELLCLIIYGVFYMALKFLPSFVMGCALNPYSLLKKCEKSDSYWACLSSFIIHASDYIRIYLRIGVPRVRAF